MNNIHLSAESKRKLQYYNVTNDGIYSCQNYHLSWWNNIKNIPDKRHYYNFLSAPAIFVFHNATPPKTTRITIDVESAVRSEYASVM